MNVTALTTALADSGIVFEEFYNGSSPLMGSIFYDWKTIQAWGTALKPKDISVSSSLFQDGYTIKWIDTDIRRKESTVDGAVSIGATTITVAAGAVFAKYDTVYVSETNETFMVSGVTGNVLTLDPSTVPTADITDWVSIKVVASIIDEDGNINGKNVTLELGAEATNYIQHISKMITFKQTDLNAILTRYTTGKASGASGAKQYTSDLIKRATTEIQEDICNSFFVGKKGEYTLDGMTFRTTGGLDSFCTAPIDCTGTNPAEQFTKIVNALDSMQGLQTVWGISPNILVCTVLAAQKITNIAAGITSITETQDLTKIGMQIKTIKSSYGDVKMIIDPVMTKLFDNANMAYTLNPKLISVLSTSILPANKAKGANDSSTLASLSGIQFFKNESDSKQPNSPATINLYTNFGFMFQGSKMGMYQKLVNLGV